MKRVQLFEFEDFDWFPQTFRRSMTRLLVVLHKLLGIDKIMAELIAKAIVQSGENEIVDLGSGSGGSMPLVMQELRSQEKWANIEMTLTDRFPDTKTINAINSAKIQGINYLEKSVDAGELDKAPKGLKTLVNSFHHMPKDVARKILTSAHHNKQPILIYEMAENKMPLWLWWVQLPFSLCILTIMSLFMTPFVRPMSASQLFFTYLIPIIPLAYAWDGQASYPRMYALKDFDELLDGLKDETYSWKIELAENAKGKKLGYYVLGIPLK